MDLLEDVVEGTIVDGPLAVGSSAEPSLELDEVSDLVHEGVPVSSLTEMDLVRVVVGVRAIPTAGHEGRKFLRQTRFDLTGSSPDASEIRLPRPSAVGQRIFGRAWPWLLAAYRQQPDA